MIAYLVNLATLVCINAILAITLNFIMGYAGIFSLAHAVFFGVGAYVAAFIALQWTDSLLLQLPAAMLIAGVISAALALPALRVRGDYFVAASLGFQVLAATVFSEWKSVTGGIGGLVGIPPASIGGYAFADPAQFLGLAGVTLALVVVLTTVIVRSSFGRSLKAIRDSESAALAFGKNVALIKTLSVFYSTAICAVAGVLYADYLSFINVESFTIDASTLFMAMVIVGGIGTVWGPIVGAVLLTLLPAALTYLPFLPRTEIGSVQQMIYGLAMVLLMIFKPDGLMGAKKGDA
ncbi:branched-chain amino acid transport system permease protein [Bradyrhizobium japonicum]|uniref:branched-chain amino acid ABC transporter permease n=1 Tax=Bradyrhizobium TaxID=374 RepID=UPI0003F4AE60|nr:MULTISPECIES: branched-chain amino acid ABC transporter permease [Bradyrhizobium]MBR0999576.1 branched-chain amino acid ABC transporter permease [Bradyrhizobium liaoningense]MBR1065210.1 branched-chain amino acid ABC transporter permease [Bradyrhizobium liaoningense]MCP1740148.1 branched-chain amino acid transport system permease protein [Bradyrhizobium japonicum]MCP1778381.1 branched-chain amino acid transport system permease protein [Bradyrhizobium japonicum]MCP1857824.1 branched-chain am